MIIFYITIYLGKQRNFRNLKINLYNTFQSFSCFIQNTPFISLFYTFLENIVCHTSFRLDIFILFFVQFILIINEMPSLNDNHSLDFHLLLPVKLKKIIIQCWFTGKVFRNQIKNIFKRKLHIQIFCWHCELFVNGFFVSAI